MASTLAGCSIFSGDESVPSDGREESTPTPTGTPTTEPGQDIPWSQRYDTVVDITDVGADPNGNESIRPLLEEHGGDDTLLYFPSGTYLMDDHWYAQSFDTLGIYGDDATIVPPKGYSESPLFILGTFDDARNLSVSGLHFDFTAPETGPSPIYALVQDGLYVEDISVEGSCRMSRFEVLEPDGNGLVRNLHLPDGGYSPEYPPGVYISEYNRGTLTFENFRIANFPNNGIYASGSRGPVRVIGGTFENNDISNVRVGDDSLVRNVTVRCTDTSDSVRNMRGIWVKGRNVSVEDCDVYLGDISVSDGAVVLNDNATVRGSTVGVDTHNVAAILGTDPLKNGNGTLSEENTQIEAVDITGKAENGTAVKMINHDNCMFTDISITQSGANRHAFSFFNVADAVIQNASIDVTADTIVRHESTIKMVNA